MDERTHKKRIEAEHANMRPETIRAAKCLRTRERNAARKRFRQQHPGSRGSKLNFWPMPMPGDE